ncbi:MAG: aconitase X catalytic domain-containing protein [Ekhidna sp.]|nr:aconitase X catalytic domain-containing protein [Ekhidna sp.]
MSDLVSLSDHDQAIQHGELGEAPKFAMDILLGVANATRAKRLVSIKSAHIVGSYYGGEADLKVLQRLNALEARVIVPTTLSSSGLELSSKQESVDYRKNCEVVEAYQNMGCRAELTCAPYHLEELPSRGDNVAWAESNAVLYANSVLGARTNMTGQYLDICAAITGRIPEVGMYLEENRKGTIIIDLSLLPQRWLTNDGFYPLLGLFLGINLKGEIPILIHGNQNVSVDYLRSLGTGIATSGNTPMFHVVGVTPEAQTLADCQAKSGLEIVKVTPSNIRAAKQMLDNGNEALSAICLGTPHFSVREFEVLRDLLGGRSIARKVKGLISTNRYNKLQIKQSGLLNEVEGLGFEVVTDTCTYYGSTLGEVEGTVLTNSAKWAYYAKANLGVDATFLNMKECVESAVAGAFVRDEAFWDAK